MGRLLNRRSVLKGLVAVSCSAGSASELWAQSRASGPLFGDKFDVPNLGMSQDQISQDPLALKIPVFETDVDIVFGIRSKSQGVSVPFPGNGVAALVNLKKPDGTTTELVRITAQELWPGGDVKGEKHIIKPYSFAPKPTGRYEIQFAGEYGLFAAWFDRWIAYGCWLGIAIDGKPSVAKIWRPDSVTNAGIKVSETYAFEKA